MFNEDSLTFTTILYCYSNLLLPYLPIFHDLLHKTYKRVLLSEQQEVNGVVAPLSHNALGKTPGTVS